MSTDIIIKNDLNNDKNKNKNKNKKIKNNRQFVSSENENKIKNKTNKVKTKNISKIYDKGKIINNIFKNMPIELNIQNLLDNFYKSLNKVPNVDDFLDKSMKEYINRYKYMQNVENKELADYLTKETSCIFYDVDKFNEMNNKNSYKLPPASHKRITNHHIGSHYLRAIAENTNIVENVKLLTNDSDDHFKPSRHIIDVASDRIMWGGFQPTILNPNFEGADANRSIKIEQAVTELQNHMTKIYNDYQKQIKLQHEEYNFTVQKFKQYAILIEKFIDSEITKLYDDPAVKIRNSIIDIINTFIQQSHNDMKEFINNDKFKIEQANRNRKNMIYFENKKKNQQLENKLQLKEQKQEEREENREQQQKLQNITILLVTWQNIIVI